MSEQHRKHNEALQPIEHKEVPSDQQESLRDKVELDAAAARHEHKELLETIQSSIDKHAESKNEIIGKHLDKDKAHEPSSVFINKELRELAYKRSLVRIRKKLSLGEKTLSSFIHQPVVEKVSEFGAKTIGRPSAVMGSSILAFIGGTTYFFITKHYGYEYNFFVFIALLAAGFVLGLLLELIMRLVRSKKQQA